EVMGGDSALIDYELLAMLRMLLERCGIGGAELVLNSVGCAKDRPAYHAALRAALAERLGELCADCQRRAQTNPLRVLDCKVPADQPIIAGLPQIGDYLDSDCRAHFDQLRALLDANGIAYRVDPRLVRGLDYYTSTAFEFVHGALGSQNALLGGGRYDGLAQALGAPAQAGGGIGFAIGEDRFVLAMQAGAGAGGDAATGPDAVAIPLTAAELQPVLELSERLRRAGLRIEVAEPGRKLGKALELAAKQHARFAVLVGAAEAAAARCQLKRLATGDQSEVPFAQLPARLGAGV